jgi:diguanylate cyclase (GGDEF)-like protein/hemerythrin-like metal-binding protein
MEHFRWDEVFLTHVDEVDQQHHHLVNLVNRLGDAISHNIADRAQINAILTQLFDYTQYHFSEEEALMSARAVDPRHVDRHLAEHAHFLEEINALKAGVDSGASTAADLLGFLTHWLAFHILGSDQNMARQLHTIERGTDPAQAFVEEEQRADRATQPLLHALNGLFEQVSQRNRELLRLNQSLEHRVAERTRALTEANAHLDRMARTDSLTQLPNRRQALDSLQAAWDADTTHLSCLMVDADRFKGVNDDHGHAAGDLVLQVLAAQLRQGARPSDLVCRLGGDEFLVLCPDTDLDAALQLAHRIHTGVNTLSVKTGDSAWAGSVSIGAAARTADMRDIHDLLKTADLSVYEAKRAGKNCVRAVQVDASRARSA